MNEDIDRLREAIRRQEEIGDFVTQESIKLSTNFPKNPPPSGISYSKNFSNFQKHGIFSTQSK